METRRKRVLAVDDDASIRTMLRRVLSPTYEVVVATHGAEALHEIRRQRPDLVLLDLRMPVMDGWELIAHLEAEGHDVPVVVISAESRRQWPNSPLVRARFAKPVGFRTLLAACAGALAEPGDAPEPEREGC